uniref:Uncharacterized protein n=1 Tax=Romanomermis culicivorax TaxID=13658 RepID=A0A915K3F4_ROMCU
GPGRPSSSPPKNGPGASDPSAYFLHCSKVEDSYHTMTCINAKNHRSCYEFFAQKMAPTVALPLASMALILG